MKYILNNFSPLLEDTRHYWKSYDCCIRSFMMFCLVVSGIKRIFANENKSVF